MVLIWVFWLPAQFHSVLPLADTENDAITLQLSFKKQMIERLQINLL